MKQIRFKVLKDFPAIDRVISAGSQMQFFRTKEGLPTYIPCAKEKRMVHDKEYEIWVMVSYAKFSPKFVEGNKEFFALMNDKEHADSDIEINKLNEAYNNATQAKIIQKGKEIITTKTIPMR